jgi:hypothetical protein
MSAHREALERAQARLVELDALSLTDAHLAQVADQLERELTAWESTLERGERVRLRQDVTGTGGRVLGFGFSLLFVAPIVAIIGSALGRVLRQEPELSVALLLLGAAVVGLTSWPRARRAVAHRVSTEWRFVRRVRAQVDALRVVALSSPSGSGESPTGAAARGSSAPPSRSSSAEPPSSALR